MIATCPKCGSYEWNKAVEGDLIVCPDCGEKWSFIKKPLYILTGCSGVGKTATAGEIQKLTTDYVVLDADFFYNIMPHDTDADYYVQIEQMESLSKNIMQCGKPVIWTKAGNIDMFVRTYNCRFFSNIYVLALVCSEENLRTRMTEGRNITDESWINSSIQYNNYFRTHSQIGETGFETLNTDGKTVFQVAEDALAWVKGHC